MKAKEASISLGHERAAWRFAGTIFVRAVEMTHEVDDNDPAAVAQVATALEAIRSEFEAGLTREHGPETAAAIIRAGHRHVRELHGLAQRYWAGELS